MNPLFNSSIRALSLIPLVSVITFSFIHSSYAEESKQSSSKIGKFQIKNAIWVPGKVGFVFNPYTQNIVDVRGRSLGSLVRDSEDPEMRRFLIPVTAATNPSVSEKKIRHQPKRSNQFSDLKQSRRFKIWWIPSMKWTP